MHSTVSKLDGPRVKQIPPTLLEQEAVWGADLYCGPAAQILLGQGLRKTLKELGGHCFEGWRVSTNPEASDYDDRVEHTPLYRQGNLEPMRFSLEAEHWQSPSVKVASEAWCVQPGDVVLNKLVPMRAVLVTDRTYRHPVDANCLLVRGLNRVTSAWVAFCLNQAPYEAYLTQHQGQAFLPRVSLRELRQLRLPPPPEAMRRLGETFWSLNDALLEIEELMMRCMEGVEASIQTNLQTLEAEGSFNRSDLGTGRFLPAEAIEDSLLPNHVENAYWRRQLRRQLQWRSLNQISQNFGVSRERLNQTSEDIPYLRLGDVGQDLMVDHVQPAPVTQATRVFKQPLGSGEVLLSTFAANSRVVFVDSGLEETIYATDHWERLRFPDTPAGWALVLNSQPIREQLEGLAMGTVQQFIYADRLQKLLLPPVPLEQRRAWEQVVLTHHQRKRELHQKWEGLWQETQQLFDEVHAFSKDRNPIHRAIASPGDPS
ncbi:restriction endonuclease subunit S [Lyngbya confervoides]|uniref:Type I restriction modification DNA specificity domain-containing protein n=1 Tax=Lyngbya confervoides BDU141951 TaxID=1574623 RepID=A0ABD4T814_9CYAN|nr:hypothetical protein [Lyngbya confervoides]MCM1984766.1 hypothetical protein [Lyngbya confervoides BDU141951]